MSDKNSMRLVKETHLLNLGFDHGVLHVVLQSLGVGLRLLQNGLHHGVVLS